VSVLFCFMFPKDFTQERVMTQLVMRQSEGRACLAALIGLVFLLGGALATHAHSPAQEFNIRPFITCIEPLSDGSGFIANFGYESFELILVQVLIGPDNFFRPTPEDRGQPVVFFPGYHERAFRVRYLNDPNNPSLIWNFLGKQVVATWGVKTCSGTSTVVPFVESITTNTQTNQATVTFGYLQNAAGGTAAIPIPVGTSNHLSPGQSNRGQSKIFLPGVQRNAFQVTLNSSTEAALLWQLNGLPAFALPNNCAAITLTTTNLQAGTVGVAYPATQLAATGGSGAYSFDVTGLPPGMSFSTTNNNLTLSGTPTQSGNYSIVVKATDGIGCEGMQTYPLRVNCPTVTLPVTTLEAGAYGVTYVAQFMPSGGTAPYTFTVTGLPAGMTRTPNINSSGTSLTLGGTPTQTGNFVVQVTATDAYGCASNTQNYALTINKATPVITWLNPANITYGTPLSATQLNAIANAAGNFTYTPPLNTVLNAGNGQTLTVSFTPSDTANFTGASKQVVINVLKAPLTVTVNNAWRNANEVNPPLTGSITGLVNNDLITLNYTTTATIVSPPGVYPITATLTDPGNRLGNYNLTNTPGTLRILPNCGLTLIPMSMAQALLGVPYAQGLVIIPAGTYTFSVLAGNLPPGLQLVNTAGVYTLQGIPTTPGTYSFTLQAQSGGSSCVIARSYTMTITPTIRPFLNCIVMNADGSITARFGYENSTRAAITVAVGLDNFFTPGTQNRGQVTTFQPGIVNNAFSVTYPNLSSLGGWFLKGPDGVLRSVVVSITAPRCPS
jgi:hypothetical protein